MKEKRLLDEYKGVGVKVIGLLIAGVVVVVKDEGVPRMIWDVSSLSDQSEGGPALGIVGGMVRAGPTSLPWPEEDAVAPCVAILPSRLSSSVLS